MANDIDSRQNKFPSARINLDTLTMVGGGGAVEGTVTEAFNGLIGTICVKLPTSTGAATATLTIKDSDGFTLYTKAGIAENASTTLDNINVLASGVLTIGMTPDVDPTNDWIPTNIILYSV